jgi:hypothetical protein
MKSSFNRTGDVKVYSKYEWLNMLKNAGFVNIEIEKLHSSFIIITTEINK